MAVAVADLERAERQQPDFGRLVAMIDRGLDRLEEASGERLSDAQLGKKIRYSTAVVYDLRKHRKVPGIEMLVNLADLFDDPREEWLEAGGYDIERLPFRWTTRARTVERLVDGLSEDEIVARFVAGLNDVQRARLEREIRDVQDKLERGELGGPNDGGGGDGAEQGQGG